MGSELPAAQVAIFLVNGNIGETGVGVKVHGVVAFNSTVADVDVKVKDGGGAVKAKILARSNSTDKKQMSADVPRDQGVAASCGVGQTATVEMSGCDEVHVYYTPLK